MYLQCFDTSDYSNRYIQAGMDKLKFIILDDLVAKKSGILD